MDRIRHWAILAVAAGLGVLGGDRRALAQTDGSAEFTVTTLRDFTRYDPDHVLAIWVVNGQGSFVKTILKQAAARERYLYTWNRESSGNDVDAVTGATLGRHTTHTATWDGRDASGTIVPDGVYRIRVEFTSEHAQGPITPLSHIQFTKGPDPVEISPPDLEKFQDMSLSYAPETETEVIVEPGSEWRFDDTGTDLHSSSWKTLEYDDSAWDSGPGKLGYGDDAVTELDYGGDSSDKHPCYYFRRTFAMSYRPESASVWVLRDDGVVVYLNGTEVARDNMDAGTTAYEDEASGTVGGSEEAQFFRFRIDPELLVVGTNVLAAEVHQGSASSSDLGFDLELRATPPGDVEPVTFRRGDVDADGATNITDAVSALQHLFQGTAAPPCISAADANDDGVFDISDAVAVLMYLFAGADDLPDPLTSCGVDPTPDDLGCEAFPACSADA